MPTPVFYAKQLVNLLKQCGLDQNTIASRLGTNKSTVSQWATGQRPVAKHHALPLLRLVEETIRFAPAHQRVHLSLLVHRWEQELYVRVGACRKEIRRHLTVLQSPYAQQDVVRLDRRERQRLFRAAMGLAQQLEIIDALHPEAGYVLDDTDGPRGGTYPEEAYPLITWGPIDLTKPIPQPDPLAELALVAHTYGITTEEEDDLEDV
jgi:hypothetical protein